LLIIRTTVLMAHRRTLKFGYEIVNPNTKALVATGETMHVFCDKQGRPKSLPAKYQKYFPPTERHGVAEPATPGKS
jgi:acyl-CoA thioesterase FadM